MILVKLLDYWIKVSPEGKSVSFDFLFADSHLKEKARKRLPFNFRCDNTQDICKTAEKCVEPKKKTKVFHKF